MNKGRPRISQEITGVIKVLLVMTAVLLFICFLFPLPRHSLEKDYSTVVRARDSTILYVSLSPRQTYRFHSSLSRISPYVKEGFIQYEDKYFFYHPGINPVAVLRAFFLNLRQKKVVSGASTITMQIARMLEPKPRTYLNKLMEMLRALELEMFYSKNELLEIYLNTVPMGGNIEGVGAASWIYFGKDAGQLSPAEAAVLVSIPRAPGLHRPDLGPENATRFKNEVLFNFYKNGIINKQLYKESLAYPIEVKRMKFPFQVPHLVLRALQEKKKKLDIFLSIDMTVQSICERIVLSYLQYTQKYKVHNLSILVVDNHTMKIRAYIGSPDFFDQVHEGQNDGVVSRRSPGSALKPFIYAKAFDKGIITPRSLIYDVPKIFKDYEPMNYSHEFLGLVDVREALIRSLNVPAVEILYKLVPFSMKNFLDEIGVSGALRSEKELGLSVALGAYPVTLENLVSMYAALANKGVLSKVTYDEEEDSFVLKKIMSEEAAYMVTDILSGLKRPDLPASWEFTKTLPRIAWKTGTSFGLSDAWSIGYNPDYTVGVWLGNFSGKGSPALVGIEIATPLLFHVFNEIARGADRWFVKPKGLMTRKVCSLSGAVPNSYCPETAEDYYIPGTSSEEPCTLHKLVKVDKRTGYMLCDFCEKGKEIKTRVIVDHPPEYITWVHEKKNVLLTPIPIHNPLCPQFASGNGPKIRFPVKGGTYYFRQNLDSKEQALALEAEAGADISKLFWFVNKQFLAESKPGAKVFFPLKPGKYKLTCLDSCGRSDEVEFSVYYR